jgi:DNA-directed RNA polymerase subunit RPC12/RpoP
MEALVCTACRRPLSVSDFNTDAFFQCPSCRARLKVDAFPALLRGIDRGKSGEVVLGEEASCFYHPNKKAEIACDYCGRFLCSLCDIPLDGKHLCLTCVEAGRKKGRITSLERHRTLYDSTALGLAVFPLVTFWFTLVTAPMALYIAIRRWNAATSVVGRGKGRLVAAIILSSLQILGWATGIAYFVSSRH